MYMICMCIILFTAMGGKIGGRWCDSTKVGGHTLLYGDMEWEGMKVYPCF